MASGERLVFIYFVLTLILSTSTEAGENESAKNIINAYVIPHSHMDVGWVYTVEESMKAFAANVYTTVVQNLIQGGHRKFIVVEQEFFRLWWDNVADYTQKLQVHQLVRNGQLEFIIGGQVMHDEALTEFSADVQQLTEGHGFIYETFGVRPQFSWHIDPFGASAATPVLFAMAGFNGHLTSRIDYDKKDNMQKSQGLEFIWQGSPSHGSKLQMFTHVMDQYSYCTPGDIPFSDKSGFYWNGYVVFPEPPKDHVYPNMSLPVNASNIKQYAEYMVQDIKARSAWFKTDKLLWPWGCDKQFFNATIQFQNMDPLMEYINEHSSQFGVTVQYATLGEYFMAVKNSSATWDVKKSGDFLPYSSDPHSAWTGFYASHSNAKGLARRSQAILNAAESLFTIHNKANISKSLNSTWILSEIKKLRWASAEVQHHDGITGTDSPPVREMYNTHLRDGQNSSLNVMASMLSDMVSNSNNHHSNKLEFVPLNSNKVTELFNNANNTVTIVAYNPLGWTVKRYINVSIPTHLVVVKDSNGNMVATQVNSPSFEGDKYQVFFHAELPPLGYKTFKVSLGIDKNSGHYGMTSWGKVHKRPIRHWYEKDYHKKKNKIVSKTTAISNKCYDVTFDDTTNLLYSITDKISGKVMKIDNLFKEYNARYEVSQGVTSTTYVFRPMGPARSTDSNRVGLHLVTGDYVKEARQNFYSFLDPNSSRYSVIIRLYDEPPQLKSTDDYLCGHVEMQFKVGPLYVNKELITRFTTNLSTDKVLYTDENAYQTMRRTHRTDVTETIAQNYYPMVSTAFVQDDKKDLRLTLLSQQSHGVSSQGNGMIEVMLHRRLIVNEEMTLNYNLTVNDTSVVMPTFAVLLGDKERSSYLQHQVRTMLENPPVVFGVSQAKETEPSNLTRKEKLGKIREFLDEHWDDKASDTPTFEDLPRNIHLLTLKTPGWTFSSDHEKHLQNIAVNPIRKLTEPNLRRVLVRLYHMYEQDEHPDLSKPVTLDLKTFLEPLGNVVNIEERSLTGIWSKKDMKRWLWNAEESESELNTEKQNQENDTEVTKLDPSAITLNPKDIKTFFVEISNGHQHKDNRRGRI